jgi:threonine-phosphate decarboxylase
MTTYQHGGEVTAFANICGCSPKEVIDLSSNINFVKPHIDVDFNAIDIAPYPNYDSLYDTIANHYGVATTQIELFNGGSSAIFSLFQHIKGRHRGLPLRCSIYSPAYLEYKKAAERFGYELHLINRFEALDAEVAEGSLVIFVNPATPDGKCYNLTPLLEMWHQKGCTVLVDESFLEFTSHPSVKHFLTHYPNLYILKSLTKYWGAAGIRMGALLSSAQNIAALKQTEPLWKLSAFDAAYIQSAMHDVSFAKRSAKAHRQGRAYLLNLLRQSPLVETIYPGEANFVLVRLKEINATALQERLLPYRVMVRNCENFDGLDDSYVRIAIKSQAQLAMLEEVFGG